MGESGAALESIEKKDEKQGLLAFFYGDALVKPVLHNEETIMHEIARLDYKEVREEELLGVSYRPLSMFS